MPKQVDSVNDMAEAVVEAVHSVMHLYRAQQYRSLRDGPHELSHMEGKALGFFVRRPEATLSDLVAHSGRDKGQIARLLASLRERGLLEAQADASDRRSLRLRPTPAGQSVHQALQRQARRLSACAVQGLSAEDGQQLLALLDRIKANLEDAV
jgi:DNA-binding MarR family transcriptional regulator